MNNERFLLNNKPGVLNAWIQAVMDSYPRDDTGFLKNQTDPFANPVGHMLREGLSGLVDSLAYDDYLHKAAPFIKELMHVRAVQDFSASQAVGFIFSLKKILKNYFKIKPRNTDSAAFLFWADARIDALALAAFDAYASCREKIHEIRVNEVRNLSYKTLQRANLVPSTEDISQEASHKDTAHQGPK